jgi:hypothetical protein
MNELRRGLQMRLRFMVGAASVAAVTALLVVGAGGAATGSLTLVSTNSSGAKADQGASALFSMSDDGSKVVFSSSSTNLVPGLAGTQVYVKDVPSGLLTLVSASSAGVAANGSNSGAAFISHNGRFVTFQSDATNLDPADTDNLTDIYVKNLATGELRLVSTNSSGVKADRASFGYAPVSDDASVVVFGSRGANLNPNQIARTCQQPPRPPVDCTTTQIYAKDLSTGVLTMLSLGDAGGNAIGGTLYASIAADGRTAAIASPQALSATDTDGGNQDVFRIAIPSGAAQLASTDRPAGTPDADAVTGYFPYISADGNRIVFQGGGAAWPPGIDSTQVWMKDMTTDVLQLVSQRQDGTPANDLSQDVEISGDGHYAAFGSFATNLDPADPDAISDVYLKNLDTGELTLISQTDAGTKGNGQSFFAAPVNGGGSVVLASGSTNLDPADADANDDLYRKLLPAPPPPDANGDGIVDTLQPTGTATDSFVDNSLSPSTFGSIVNGAGLTVTITDAPDAVDGVQIVIGPGSGRATLNVCGFVFRPSAGSTSVITCGSISVKAIVGTAAVELGGGITVVTFPEGSAGKVSTGSNGGFTVANTGEVPLSIIVNGTEGTVAAHSTSPVSTWRFAGFDQPVDNLPTLNRVKAGQAIPLKWRLLTSDGAPVTNLTSAKLTVAALACSATAPVDDLEQVVATASGLQNLGNGYYQLNWKSDKAYAGSCKTLHLDLGEGVTHDATFNFTK